MPTTIFPLSSVDCEWGEWGEWSSCDKFCTPIGTSDHGTIKRNRPIKTVAQYNGVECQGANITTNSCNTHECPRKLERLKGC